MSSAVSNACLASMPIWALAPESGESAPTTTSDCWGSRRVESAVSEAAPPIRTARRCRFMTFPPSRDSLQHGELPGLEIGHQHGAGRVGDGERRLYIGGHRLPV